MLRFSGYPERRAANMHPEITKAVSVFRDSPDMEDEQIYRTLVKEGVGRRLAARLVEFLPGAYCRAILEDTGARFSDTFQRIQKDGTISREIALSSEPVWAAALEFARREIRQGLSRDEKLRLAGRSAEFQAANDLLRRGSRLEHLIFTPAIHPWPEDGPDIQPISATPDKPWWQFWS
jgi:hypothetical protein